MPNKWPTPGSHYRSPTAVPATYDIHDADVFSSALIGSGAHGVVKIFVSPQGQPVQRIGKVPDDLFPTTIPMLTNMTRSAQLGCGIGDMRIDAMRADFIGGHLPDIQRVLDGCEFQLKIAGKREVECGLRDLPKVLTAPLLVARYDTLEAVLAFDKKLDALVEPVLLRVVLSGAAMHDVR